MEAGLNHSSFKMLTKRDSVAHYEEQDKQIKKREEFAISLRKKKHTEIITTKRKALMQRAFESTTSASDASLGVSKEHSSGEFIEINSEAALLRYIDLIDKVTPGEPERIKYLKSLRNLTISSQDYRLSEIVESN